MPAKQEAAKKNFGLTDLNDILAALSDIDDTAVARRDRPVYPILNPKPPSGRTLTVYRLLRSEERPCSQGLMPPDGCNGFISASAHIESGTWEIQKSRFISTSLSLLVCLFYAMKKVNYVLPDDDDGEETLWIAKIRLDLDTVRGRRVYDLTDRQNERRLRIVQGSTASNYARLFQEVLVDGFILPEEIRSVDRVADPEQLPMAKSYRQFRQRMLREHSSTALHGWQHCNRQQESAFM